MQRRYELFGRYVDRCESFIERRFLVALLFSEQFSFEPLVTEHGGIAVDREGILLGQQVPAGAFRLDFAFKRRGYTARVNVELDGHRYHDASAEKAEQDRARDRLLTSLGWRVVRYASREIIRDPLGCARQAYELALMVSTKPVMPTIVKAETTGREQLMLPAPRGA